MADAAGSTGRVGVCGAESVHRRRRELGQVWAFPQWVCHRPPVERLELLGALGCRVEASSFRSNRAEGGGGIPLGEVGRRTCRTRSALSARPYHAQEVRKARTVQCKAAALEAKHVQLWCRKLRDGSSGTISTQLSFAEHTPSPFRTVFGHPATVFSHTSVLGRIVAVGEEAADLVCFM